MVNSRKKPVPAAVLGCQQLVLGHISLGSDDLARAGDFYDAALAALGYVRVWTAETAIGYGVECGGDKLAIKRVTPGGERLCAGPGFHLAFDAPSRAAVDAFHAAALAAGGTCNGPPGLRPHYGATYYAAFVVDPDGHRLEAVHQ